METKKISFGFSKITQKNNLIQLQPKEEPKVELIKCFEGKEMKLVNEPKPEELLVIPMKEVGKTSAALASLMKRRAVLNDEEEETPAEPTKETNGNSDAQTSNENENLEQKAARELLAEAKAEKESIVDNKLVLPVLKPDELPLDGAKESTFDDYEAIPVEQFGRAMLRGMGWVDPPPTEKDKKMPEGPVPRPKGMGLGADKAIKTKPLLIQPEKNEVLEIKRKAYVRVLAGKQKDLYGQIEDFDDFAGRIIVRMAIGGAVEVFNEFMCQPVAKKEYEQYGKCINAAKYEAYKKLENEYGQIMLKGDEHDSKEIHKSDLKSDFKQPKEEKRDRHSDEKYTEKSYERSKDREREDRRYKDEKSLKTYDSRSRSPSNKASTSSHHSKNGLSSSTSRDYKDSELGTSHASRSRHKRKHADSDAQSSDSESTNSDDSHEHRRRHKKKSSSKKKSKKSKSRRREFSSASEDDSSDAEKRHKSHKKKTKKSKRQRSRSRSRGKR